MNLTFPHFRAAAWQSSTTPHCSSSRSDEEAKIYAALVGINNPAATVQMMHAWGLKKSLSPPEQLQMSLLIKDKKYVKEEKMRLENEELGI